MKEQERCRRWHGRLLHPTLVPLEMKLGCGPLDKKKMTESKIELPSSK